MALNKVKAYFEELGLGDRVFELKTSTATVKEAAEAIGCEDKQIAKSLSFLVGDQPILIVTAGNVRVDNKKFKNVFQTKAKMIPAQDIEDYIGHDIGGVCPFAIKPEVEVYLDESLKQNTEIYPAAGSERSVVRLRLEELEAYSHCKAWVDVSKF